MTICPVALAVGCKKCLVFSLCPVKSVIGDYKKDSPSGTTSSSQREKSGK